MSDRPPALQHRQWRVGGHWGKTIVAMGGDDPSVRHADDELVGLMLSDSLAQVVVRDHNAELERRKQREGWSGLDHE